MTARCGSPSLIRGLLVGFTLLSDREMVEAGACVSAPSPLPPDVLVMVLREVLLGDRPYLTLDVDNTALCTRRERVMVATYKVREPVVVFCNREGQEARRRYLTISCKDSLVVIVLDSRTGKTTVEGVPRLGEWLEPGRRVLSMYPVSYSEDHASGILVIDSRWQLHYFTHRQLLGHGDDTPLDLSHVRATYDGKCAFILENGAVFRCDGVWSMRQLAEGLTLPMPRSECVCVENGTREIYADGTYRTEGRPYDPNHYYIDDGTLNELLQWGWEKGHDTDRRVTRMGDGAL